MTLRTHIRKWYQSRRRPAPKRWTKPSISRHRRILLEALEDRRLLVLGITTIPPLIHPGEGYDGVVALDFSASSTPTALSSQCTGSLLSTGRHILTAAHCVTDNAGNPDQDDVHVAFELSAQNYIFDVDLTAADALWVHPDWNGDVDDGADLAIIQLPALAPFAADRYNIYTPSNELNNVITIVGYGNTGTGAGQLDGGIAEKRFGYNEIGDIDSFANGDVLRYDFDDGTAANNTLGDSLGLGSGEALTGTGDSGGPWFMDGRFIAAVTSFGGTNAGAIDRGTRLSQFVGDINDVLTESSDIVLDMNFQTAGNDGTADHITVRRDPNDTDRVQILIGEQEIWSDEDSRITSLTILGSGDDDLLIVDHSNGDPVVGSLTFDGRSPTASDSLTVIGTVGSDEFDVLVIGADAALINVNGGADINVFSTESVLIDGASSTNDSNFVNDTLNYTGIGAGENRIVFTPGEVADEGRITGFDFFGDTPSHIPVSFQAIGSESTIHLDANSLPGQGVLVIRGTDGSDGVAVTGPNGDIELGSTLVGNSVNLTTEEFSRLVLETYAGDDLIVIEASDAYDEIDVFGGDPSSGSDELIYVGSGSAVTVSLDIPAVFETGLATVSYAGIERLTVDAGAGDLTVVGTGGPDVITVAPTSTISARITEASHNLVINAASTGTFTIDPDTGSDRVQFLGTSAGEVISVTSAAVQVGLLKMVELVTANTEALAVSGLEGDDTFNVAAGALPIFIDGGDPIGESSGDVLNVDGGGNLTTFEAGPEKDEGGFVVATQARISFDHIEEIALANVPGALIAATNADDDITIIARDNSTHPGTDGQQDFTVSVNQGPNVLFIDVPTLYVDALAGDDDIVVRTPAPNNAEWDVDLFLAGGPPSDGDSPEGDRLVLETPHSDTLVFTPTSSETGTILIDEAGNDSLFTLGAFTVGAYISSPGGVEHFEYDGEAGDDTLTIVGTAADDTIVHTPGSGFDEGSLRVNTLLGVVYQNLGAAGRAQADGGAGDADTLVYRGTELSDAFEVAASGDVHLSNSTGARIPVGTTSIAALVLDGLAGDDSFTLDAGSPYALINVNGSGPSGSDSLTINGVAGTDEAFTVDPAETFGDGAVTVVGGGVAVTAYTGVEHLFLDANDADTDSLVVLDDLRDNLWTVSSGTSSIGDIVQIEGREAIDYGNFATVVLRNEFGTDTFRIAPSNLVGFNTSLTVEGDGTQPVDDVLQLLGTPGNDVVTSTATAISINGVAITAGANLVEVQVLTLAGDDTVTLGLGLAGVRKLVDGGSGNDTIDMTTTLDAYILGGVGDDVIIGTPLADLIDGGQGNDSISGLGGNDTIYGGEGNDTAVGGTGADQFFGGDGSDVFIWNQGDGSDLIEGDVGADVVVFNGATSAQLATENFTLSPTSSTTTTSGARLLLNRTQGNVNLDMAGVEQVDINGDTGVETVVVNDLTQTELEVLNIDVGAGGSAESVTVNGRSVADQLAVTASAGIVTVAGLKYDVNLANTVVGDGDRLTVNGNEGDDLIEVGAGVETAVLITLNGDAGKDSLFGGAGPDILNGGLGDDYLEGGAGADAINGGAGEDLMVGGAGADTFDGGADFDTILVRGTSGNDVIDVVQSAATTLSYTLNGATETDTLVLVAGVGTVEEVRVEAGRGADLIRVRSADSLAVDANLNALRVSVYGGEDSTQDRLAVVDDGTADLVLYRKSEEDSAGTVTVGPGNAEPLLTVFEGIERVQFVDDAGAAIVQTLDGPRRLVVFKHDPFEYNDDLLVATHLGAGESLNLDPTIDPGASGAPFNLPGDVDVYRVVADVTGTLDFQVYFRQYGAIGARPGLPNAGNLDIQVLDAAGNVIAGFGVNDATDDERIRIPAVAGQTYFLRVFGAAAGGVEGINNYNVTVLNDAPPVPYDLELDDFPVNGETNPPGQSDNSDTGRSQFDNITYDATPVIRFRLDDAIFLHDLPGNPNDDTSPDEVIRIPFEPSQETQNFLDVAAANDIEPGFRVAVFVEGTPQQPGQLPQVPVGYARQIAEGVYEFDFASDRIVNGASVPYVLTDGSHFISARVEIIDPTDLDGLAANGQATHGSGFGDRSESLEIVVDTLPPPVFFGFIGLADTTEGLDQATDSGVIDLSETFADRITNVTTPTFFGTAEADAVVRIYLETNGIAGFQQDADTYLGLTVALPYDGTNQFPDGQWTYTLNRDLNDPDLGLEHDGLRTLYVTAEDVAGNLSAADTLEIFVDTQGPQITDVFITGHEAYNLFGIKPGNAPQGPTPLVDSLTVEVRDLPPRVVQFLYEVLADPANVGYFSVVGDYNGIIPIESVTYIADPPVAGEEATGRLIIAFFEPLPDDRLTLTIDDAIVDLANNALDGESNADEPNGNPIFPTGDGIPGGDFVARFTVDSRAEIGTWAGGSIWVDTNNNGFFDPNNLDFVNRDIIYALGLTTDDIFAGNFVAGKNAVADGFDKLAAYGNVNGKFRWLIDFDNDGVPDPIPGLVNNIEPKGVNGLPIAGNFDGNAANGDEVGVFTGSVFWLDTNHDFKLDKEIKTSMKGLPFAGDVNGDGVEDLGTWTDDVFQIEFGDGAKSPPNRYDGKPDVAFRFGFIGVREQPVVADMNGDGFDDLGLWVPDREGQTPREIAEWYFLVSDDAPVTDRVRYDALLGVHTIDYKPDPFGEDVYFQFGDDFALPVVGNFDPPVGDTNRADPEGVLNYNTANPFDVNDDGTANVADVRELLKVFIAEGPHQFTKAAAGAPYADVNQDGRLTSADVASLLTHLMSSTGATGEGESTEISSRSSADDYFAWLGSVPQGELTLGPVGVDAAIDLLQPGATKRKR